MAQDPYGTGPAGTTSNLALAGAAIPMYSALLLDGTLTGWKTTFYLGQYLNIHNNKSHFLSTIFHYVNS